MESDNFYFNELWSSQKAQQPNKEDLVLKLNNYKKKYKLIIPIFHCSICNNPVRPHNKSKMQAAHFEHYKQNSECSLSVAFDKP